MKPFIYLLFLSVLQSAICLGQSSSSDMKILLSQEWQIDSLEFIDTKERFPAPTNIKNNYLIFDKNGKFNSQDSGINLNGKWNFDHPNMKIINSDIDHPEVKGDIVFDVVSLTQKRLVFTSQPMSGGQVKMIYKSRKINKHPEQMTH